jgi:tetratricopeptide (TPR) repeat protein
MRSIIFLFLLTVSAGCVTDTRSFQEQLEDVRKDFADGIRKQNAEMLADERIVNEVYTQADTNIMAALQHLDSLLHGYKPSKISMWELHFIKGDIFYNADSLQKALYEFDDAESRHSSPKGLAARAGVYVKLKRFDEAHADLKRAIDVNYYYNWNLGNYYEIRKNRDSAIACYDRLYLDDTTYYRYCKERVIELQDPKTKLFTELIYRDR